MSKNNNLITQFFQLITKNQPNKTPQSPTTTTATTTNKNEENEDIEDSPSPTPSKSSSSSSTSSLPTSPIMTPGHPLLDRGSGKRTITPTKIYTYTEPPRPKPSSRKKSAPGTSKTTTPVKKKVKLDSPIQLNDIITPEAATTETVTKKRTIVLEEEEEIEESEESEIESGSDYTDSNYSESENESSDASISASISEEEDSEEEKESKKRKKPSTTIKLPAKKLPATPKNKKNPDLSVLTSFGSNNNNDDSLSTPKKATIPPTTIQRTTLSKPAKLKPLAVKPKDISKRAITDSNGKKILISVKSDYRKPKNQGIFVDYKKKITETQDKMILFKDFIEVPFTIEKDEKVISRYLPSIKESKKIAFSSDKDRVFELTLFESMYTKQSDSQDTSGFTMFVGGYVSAMEWCPLPGNSEDSDSDNDDDDDDEEQGKKMYIAIAAHKDCTTTHFKREVYKSSNIIQIWELDSLGKHSDNLPKISYAFKHEGDYVTDLKWLPYGGFVAKKDRNIRLGILAVGFGDGTVKVYSIPHPDQVQRYKENNNNNRKSPKNNGINISHNFNNDLRKELILVNLTPIFDQPVNLCHLPEIFRDSKPPPEREYVCNSISWSMCHNDTDSPMLLCGSTNGSVQIYDIGSLKPFINTKTQKEFTYEERYSIPIFMTQEKQEISNVVFSPHDKNLFIILSRRTVSLWDRRQPDRALLSHLWPFSSKSGVIWPSNTNLPVILISDGNSIRVYDLVTTSNSVLFITDNDISSIDISDSLRFLTTCSADGTVKVFPLYPEKRNYVNPPLMNIEQVTIVQKSDDNNNNNNDKNNKNQTEIFQLSDSHEKCDFGPMKLYNNKPLTQIQPIESLSFPDKRILTTKSIWCHQKGYKNWLIYSTTIGIVRCKYFDQSLKFNSLG